MAGDWIKMRTNLDTDPRVIEMASALGTNELHIVGMLWKVWAWADSHTLDGNAIRVTGVTLDRFTGCTGFADVLRKVGWLDGRDNAITFPRFAEHNGQTAKKRAETKERVAKHRNAKAVTDVTQKALPEKRREEKSKTPTHTQAEGFEKAWQRWVDYRESVDPRPMSPIQADAVLMDLSRRGAAKAERDIEFSIRKGSRSILDSDNDFERQRSARSSGTGKKGKTFEEIGL